jgi:hypothetical protein
MKGIAAFKKRLLELTNSNHTNVIDTLIKDVKKSGTKNIAFRQFDIPIGGVSTETGDIFIADKHISLSDIVFVTLHESAHQLQYKKYGNNHATDIWFDGLIKGADTVASKVKHIEDVANRYAFMKFKKYQAQFGLRNISNHINTATYMPENAYAANMNMYLGMLKRRGVTTKEELKEAMITELNKNTK